MASKLFTPLQVGRMGLLKHRVVLAPLTRNRALEPDLVPSELAVQYYKQRASDGGLLITEATCISPEALAYPAVPGIWTDKQVDGWKRVTDAVHEKGGFISCQLWHTGRVAHPDYALHPVNKDLNYQTCVSASPQPVKSSVGRWAKTVTYSGIKEHGTPKELTKDDILRLHEDYARAAQNAKDAGFDGVELHAAHGYLIDQFLNDGVNQRTDEYGGSPENRCRLMKEVLDVLVDVWSADRVGVRLSPHDGPNGGNVYYGATDSNPDLIYGHAVKLLNTYNLAYLLLTEPRWVGKHDGDYSTDPGFQMPLLNLEKYRSLYDGVMIGAGGFTPATSYEMSEKDDGYDALAFGRWFISNPDLPARLQAWHEYEQGGRTGDLPPFLNRYERNTFYTQEADGLVDYPSMEFDAASKEGSDTSKDEWNGMTLDKYPLVNPADVGTSLKATEQKSKL
eukprot:Nitzschia sp. Nitz4//scaffold180_size44305//22214//23563//NITZ4_007240-RA/size44305-processed-gene-0.22-mRNA-1//-1//CDS//3329539470//3120//frame0